MIAQYPLLEWTCSSTGATGSGLHGPDPDGLGWKPSTQLHP
jgi:hypothetical protein